MINDIYKDLSILCIEDEEGVRRHIVNTLSYYFCKVYEASNGQEGLDVYHKRLPDIILCDIEMPFMNGIELVNKIRTEDLTTPIVVLTAYSNEEYLIKLINLQIQHYILKPINAERLLQAINKAFLGKYTGCIKISENILLYLDSKVLQIDKKEITLSLRETRFLSLLATNKEQTVYYSTIEEKLWKDKPMSNGAIKSFVRDLRKKIPFEIIENISQVGYRIKPKL